MRSLGYTVRRYFVDAFYTRRVADLSPGSRVLDLGGNRIRKRGVFNIERYPLCTIYANIVVTKRPHVQADGAALPFGDGSFDAVISAELLEHVPSPERVLREVHRVLRPGGRLLITVPLLYRVHGDPQDFGRYTDHFWLCVLGDLGFETVAIERQGLFFSVMVDFFKQYLYTRGVRRPFGRLSRSLLALLQQRALLHERQIHVCNDAFRSSFTTGFGIVGVKQPARRAT